MLWLLGALMTHMIANVGVKLLYHPSNGKLVGKVEAGL